MGGFGGTSGGGGGGGKNNPGNVSTSAQFGLSKEFPADNAVRMPVYNSLAQQEAARILQSQISARSGRSSTSLVNMPGVGTYASSFLGSAPGAAK